MVNRQCRVEESQTCEKGNMLWGREEKVDNKGEMWDSWMGADRTDGAGKAKFDEMVGDGERNVLVLRKADKK